MSVDAKPRIGDEGTIILIDMGEDLSGASLVSVKYFKPDRKTIGTLEGSVDSTTKIKAITTAAFLDMEGDYILVPYAEDLGGWTGHGDPVKMHVYGIYEVVE